MDETGTPRDPERAPDGLDRDGRLSPGRQAHLRELLFDALIMSLGDMATPLARSARMALWAMEPDERDHLLDFVVSTALTAGYQISYLPYDSREPRPDGNGAPATAERGARHDPTPSAGPDPGALPGTDGSPTGPGGHDAALGAHP